MFDMENLRTTQFDQFQPRRVFTLAAEAEAVTGGWYPPGWEFRFDYAIVNVYKKDAEIHGFGADGSPLVFRTRAGEHRDLFVFTGREWWPEEEKKEPLGPPVLEGAEREWLAQQPGFERASAILAGNYETGDWGAAHRDADVLRFAAKRLEKSHPKIARFLASESVHLYYCWTAQATSGGEGTAMSHSIREELKEMRRLAGDE